MVVAAIIGPEPPILAETSSGFADELRVLLLALVIAQKCTDRTVKVNKPLKHGDFDFIVVGGGTGGAIVAARLSANFNVLLIESGEKLYDDAALSAKYLTGMLTGHEFSSIFDAAAPYLKNTKKTLLETNITDPQGDPVNSMPAGVPGFMMHLQETPFMALYMTMTEAAHYYPTVPQIYSQKREIDYPRGNCLGGSSAANTMVYFRGSKHDFDQWGNELGLKGWAYKDVLPYFKKYENNVDVSDTRLHGHKGPINITISKKHFPSPATDEYTAAALRLGWPKIEDASNPETVYGASDSWQQFVGANGKRSDTSDYIRLLDAQGKVCWNKLTKEDCSKEQRLSVWTKKFVTKVMIDTNTKRAFGVEYVDDATEHSESRSEHVSKGFHKSESEKHHSPYNKWDRLKTQARIPTLGAPVDKDLATDFDRTSDQYIPEDLPDLESMVKRVTARYEVILAAGSVGSGQLLMLSGVGPRDHLNERSIQVLSDLPVGRRMQDHQEVISQWVFPKDFTPAFDFKWEAMKGFPTLRSHLRGERSFFSANGVPAGLEGSSAGPKGTIPKWHLHHLTMGAFENFDYNLAIDDISVLAPYRLPRSMKEMMFWKGLTMHLHNCELSQNHAYGRLELRSRDPFQPPFLDPRYGSSDEDNNELAHCLETVREIMAESDPKYVGHEVSACARAKTRPQLIQCVRNSVWGHHISGSAPMGNCSTPYAVTDERARVFNIAGLRLADISLVPTLPHGNPAGVVMMMAEKISDMIKEDYGVKIDPFE